MKARRVEDPPTVERDNHVWYWRFDLQETVQEMSIPIFEFQGHGVSAPEGVILSSARRRAELERFDYLEDARKRLGWERAYEATTPWRELSDRHYPSHRVWRRVIQLYRVPVYESVVAHRTEITSELDAAPVLYSGRMAFRWAVGAAHGGVLYIHGLA